MKNEADTRATLVGSKLKAGGWSDSQVTRQHYYQRDQQYAPGRIVLVGDRVKRVEPRKTPELPDGERRVHERSGAICARPGMDGWSSTSPKSAGGGLNLSVLFRGRCCARQAPHEAGERFPGRSASSPLITAAHPNEQFTHQSSGLNSPIPHGRLVPSAGRVVRESLQEPLAQYGPPIAPGRCARSSIPVPSGRTGG